MTFELELRFQVPTQRYARARRALVAKTARSIEAPEEPAKPKELGGHAQRAKRISRSISCQGTTVEVSTLARRIDDGATGEPRGELVFRWVDGPVQGLLALADRWVDRYGLWLYEAQPDTSIDPPRPNLSRHQSPDAALRCMVRDCLARVLPNLSAIACDRGTPEHLHQLRVGLRCMRSALREFAGWSRDRDPRWEAELKQLFGRLSQARDLDVLDSVLIPQLRAAGGPEIELSARALVEPAATVLRCESTTKLLLALIVFARSAPNPDGAATASLKELADASLRRQHRRLRKAAALFMSADTATKHRLRKRLKRLRYCIELCDALYRGKAIARYIVLLREAQDELGRYMDLAMAQTYFRAQTAHDARAWFAVGWFSARHEPGLQAAVQALEALEAGPRFWRP